jgi:TPR repeat protein
VRFCEEYEHGTLLKAQYFTNEGTVMDKKDVAALMVNHAEFYMTLRNFAEAATWFRKAAGLGNADGMNTLGVLYTRGLGVPKSITAAAGLFQKAADLGCVVAKDNLAALSCHQAVLP